MLITALLMAGVLTAGDPDGVVATAPATAVDLAATARPVAPSVEGAAQAGVPHNLTTDEQIDRWIAARTVDERPYDRPRGEPLDDGLPHGEVSLSVGTGGYRDYGAAISLPIGENGRLSLAYRQTENGYPYGDFGYGDGYDQPWGRAAIDHNGYAFTGYRPGAAADPDTRMTEADGPSNRRIRPRQRRAEP